VAKTQNNKSADNAAYSNVSRNVANEDISLIDCVLVLIKHKWFILLGSVTPAFILGLVVFLLPRHYEIRYTYRMPLNETGLRVLENKFYSAENTEKLSEKFREHGRNDYIRKLAVADIGGNGQWAGFEVFPPLFDTTAKTLDELQKRQETRGTLLVFRMRDNTPTALLETAGIYRFNFEQVVLLYLEKDKLTNKIISLKGDMADIEETRFTLNQQLERKKSTLEKLKKSASEPAAKQPDGIVLQFDSASGSGDYLPLSFQIQAVQTQQINLEENIRSKSEQYAYLAEMLALNETLLEYLKQAEQSHFTVGQFHAFLMETQSHYAVDSNHLKDYLNAYIKRIENEMASSSPLSENPKMSAIPNGTLKKTAVIFSLAFILSIMGAFLREGLQQRKLLAQS
jgi:hypothetical protein